MLPHMLQFHFIELSVPGRVGTVHPMLEMNYTATPSHLDGRDVWLVEQIKFST